MNTKTLACALAVTLALAPATLLAEPAKAPAATAKTAEKAQPSAKAPAATAKAPAATAKTPEKTSADASDATTDGPTPEQLKARKQKKPVYAKAAEAIKVAEAAGQPIMMFIFIEQNPVSDFLEKKVLANKLFRDDLAKQNAVLLKLKVKRNQGGGKDAKDKGKKIDLRGLKDAERKLIENFGLDEKAAKQAVAHGQPERTYMDAINYPAIICLSPDGTKQLFRMGNYDRDGGMGVWISTVVDTLRMGGIDPVISPKIQKILDNPDDPKKWK